MSNTLWGIAMLIILIVDLVMIPGELAKGKYTSAAFSIAGVIFSAIEGIAYDLADAYEKEYRANPAYENEERMCYWRYMGPKHWSSKSNYDPYLPH